MDAVSAAAVSEFVARLRSRRRLCGRLSCDERAAPCRRGRVRGVAGRASRRAARVGSRSRRADVHSSPGGRGRRLRGRAPGRARVVAHACRPPGVDGRSPAGQDRAPTGACCGCRQGERGPGCAAAGRRLTCRAGPEPEPAAVGGPCRRRCCYDRACRGLRRQRAARARRHSGGNGVDGAAPQRTLRPPLAVATRPFGRVPGPQRCGARLAFAGRCRGRRRAGAGCRWVAGMGPLAAGERNGGAGRRLAGGGVVVGVFGDRCARTGSGSARVSARGRGCGAAGRCRHARPEGGRGGAAVALGARVSGGHRMRGGDSRDRRGDGQPPADRSVEERCDAVAGDTGDDSRLAAGACQSGGTVAARRVLCRGPASGDAQPIACRSRRANDVFPPARSALADVVSSGESRL